MVVPVPGRSGFVTDGHSPGRSTRGDDRVRWIGGRPAGTLVPVTHPDLARRIHAAAHLAGRFTLRSGRTATEYFDKYRFEADPVLLDEIACRMAALVPADTQVLAGLEMGGIPVVTALGRHTGLPCAFVRKTAKPYGTRRLAEGAEVDGRRVLVVEDVVTSGGQIVLSTAELRDLGALVNEALCVIDREQGGAGALAAEGISLLSLLTADDLRAAAGHVSAGRLVELPKTTGPQGEDG